MKKDSGKAIAKSQREIETHTEGTRREEREINRKEESAVLPALAESQLTVIVRGTRWQHCLL